MSWFDTRMSKAYVAGSMRRTAIALGLSALLFIPASAWSQDEPKPEDAPPPPEQTDVKSDRPDAVRSDSPSSIAGIDAVAQRQRGRDRPVGPQNDPDPD